MGEYPYSQEPDDLTIRTAQSEQPWTVPYADRHRFEVAAYCSAFSGRHALMHAMKSLGKVAAEFEKLDHDNQHNTLTDAQIDIVSDMAADLFTVALRFANVYRFDLALALVRRVQEKNR